VSGPSAATGPSTARGVCALVAILAIVLVFVWTAARIHFAFGGNWSAVFCAGALVLQPPDLDAGVYRFEGIGYDGQFYRYLAHDPSLQKGYSRYVDFPQLRFRRILVPLAAWVLAFGQGDWVDRAYFAVEMLFIGLGVYWCSRLLARRGRSPLWGLLFVIVPATLTSFDRMLIDGPLTALFAGFLLYCDEERRGRVWILAMLAALTRETGLFLGAALAAERLLHRDWRLAAWYASSAVPAAAWYAYVATHASWDGPVAELTFPAWGLFRRLLVLRPYFNPRVQPLIRITDVLAVVGLAISIILAAKWIVDRGLGPATLCVGVFAVLALLLGPLPMAEAYGFGRPVSPLLLWIMLEAVSRKTWPGLIPPLLISLSVSLAFGRPLIEIMKGLFSGY
jgi:hypothetical protein